MLRMQNYLGPWYECGCDSFLFLTLSLSRMFSLRGSNGSYLYIQVLCLHGILGCKEHSIGLSRSEHQLNSCLPLVDIPVEICFERPLDVAILLKVFHSCTCRKQCMWLLWARVLHSLINTEDFTQKNLRIVSTSIHSWVMHQKGITLSNMSHVLEEWMIYNKAIINQKEDSSNNTEIFLLWEIIF